MSHELIQVTAWQAILNFPQLMKDTSIEAHLFFEFFHMRILKDLNFHMWH